MPGVERVGREGMVKRDSGGDSSAEVRARLNALVGEIERLRRENAELRDENEDLKRALEQRPEV